MTVSASQRYPDRGIRGPSAVSRAVRILTCSHPRSRLAAVASGDEGVATLSLRVITPGGSDDDAFSACMGGPVHWGEAVGTGSTTAR